MIPFISKDLKAYCDTAHLPISFVQWRIFRGKGKYFRSRHLYNTMRPVWITMPSSLSSYITIVVVSWTADPFPTKWHQYQNWLILSWNHHKPSQIQKWLVFSCNWTQLPSQTQLLGTDADNRPCCYLITGLCVVFSMLNWHTLLLMAATWAPPWNSCSNAWGVCLPYTNLSTPR